MLFRYVSYTRIKKLFDNHVRRGLFNKDSKNIFRQIFELIWLTVRGGYWPHNYYKFKVYQKDADVKDFVPFIPGRLYDCIREDVLNDRKYENVVENKYLFYLTLRDAGVPTPRVYGRFLDKFGVYNDRNSQVDTDAFLEALKTDIVIKPVQGTAQGMQVDVINIDRQNGMVFNMRGKDMDKGAFKDYLQKTAERSPAELLIQEKLEQHSEMAKFSDTSLNTVRVNTLRTITGEVMQYTMFVRMGKGGRTVDNWSGPKGGILVGVDPETGALHDFGYDFYLNKYYEHPDTGLKFAGLYIPMFDMLKDRVDETAKLFTGIHAVGWDVAISHEGPVLIEGNADHGVVASQLVSGPYLSNKVFVKAVSEHLKRSSNGKRYEKYFSLK